MNFSGQMSWFDFLCLALASGALIDLWRNGSLFEEKRATVEVEAGRYWEGDGGNWWSALLDCAFCFGYHVPYAVAVVFYLPSLVWPRWAVLWKMPLYCLAATRVGWVLNGVLPDHLKYGYRTNKGRDADNPPKS